jgi:glucose-1-phosphate adenylyltransferase
MDYGNLIESHRASGSAVTVAVKHQSQGVPPNVGALDIDGDNIVRTFVEKPGDQSLELFSLGIYVFSKDVLLDGLCGLSDDQHDLVFDMLIPAVQQSKVRAYLFDGYWADVGWLQQYYESSMALLKQPPLFRLDDPDWPVFSKAEIRSPTLIGLGSHVESSLIASGCCIQGCVRQSILFPGVKVKSGAVVEHSIIFSDAVIKPGASVRYSVIDKRAGVGQDALVGYGNPTCPNSLLPEIMSSGVTVIGTQTKIPDGIRIGRNCLVGNDLSPEAIPNRDIVCGETILGDMRWQKISS